MSIVVYWLDPQIDHLRLEDRARARSFKAEELLAALKFCEDLRGAGISHVSLSSENPNSVGKPGVDSIVDGKTPDGQEYTWMKRRAQ